MAYRIAYEWAVEPVDIHGDVLDVTFTDTFLDALDFAAHFREKDWGKETLASVDVALVRIKWDDYDDSLVDRWYAYLGEQGSEPGRLPANFETDNGGFVAAVPKRFFKEVDQVYKAVSNGRQ